ncbi:transposase [Skermania sp. ID1734]|nr:transposase [Skermania sp. ID1734]
MISGSQYTSIRRGETLMISGLIPSIGSVGNAYDNALAEPTIGLYRTESMRADSPFRGGPLHNVCDVESVTAHWVDWYNNPRLMYRLDCRPPGRVRGRLPCTSHRPAGWAQIHRSASSRGGSNSHIGLEQQSANNRARREQRRDHPQKLESRLVAASIASRRNSESLHSHI